MKLFRFMKRPDQLTVVGVVEIDGVAHKVKVLAPLLVQDAQAWLSDLVSDVSAEAQVAARRGDLEAANELRQMADALDNCANGVLDSSGIPAVDARLAVRVLRWSKQRWTTCLRTLVRLSTPVGDKESPEFLMSADRMIVSDKLHWLSPYCSAMSAEESSSASVRSVARRAAHC